MPRGGSRRASVISPAGRRDTAAVGALRLLGSIATGAAIVGIGHMIDGAGASALIVVGVGALLAGVFAYLEYSLGGAAARAEERRIRTEVLIRQFAPESAAQRSDFPPARVIDMLTTGAEKATEFRQVYLGSTAAALLVPLAALAYIGVAIDPAVGFITLALIPLIPLVIGVFLLAVRKSADFSQASRGVVTARYLDVIRNLTTIRLFNAGERIGTELRGQAERNRATLMRMLARNQTMIMILDSMFTLVFLVAAVGLVLWRAEHLTIGDGVSVALLAVLLLEPLQQVAGFFFVGIGGIRAQKELRAFFTAFPPANGRDSAQTDSADTDTASVDASGLRSGADEPGTGAGVSLRGISFDYGRGPVLTEVNLDVAPGERVAIVGPSGSGKSTLLALIGGSLPVQEGEVLIGPHTLEAGQAHHARYLCAAVSQSTWMFTGTIAENLRIAREDATTEQMWRALRLAHVADEIQRMPQGLDTHLGEGALAVSGGQAQRLSLARALLSGRKVLLLDEVTSQVDADSEARIVDAITGLPREWTVLMVTHRPSMLRAADRTFTLEGRALVEARDIPREFIRV